jgi:peroxiredoxin
MLQVGDRVPPFKMASTGGTEVTLEEILAKHRATIFAVYVLDFTPG